MIELFKKPGNNYEWRLTMKNRNGFMIWGVLLTVVLMSSIGYGQPEKMKFRKDKDSALNLTDKQDDKIKGIRKEFAPKIIDAQAAMKKHQVTFKTLMDADKPNQRAINAAIDDGAKLRAAIQKLRTAQHLEVRSQLTPEQLKIMKSRGGRHLGDGMGCGDKKQRGGHRSKGKGSRF